LQYKSCSSRLCPAYGRALLPPVYERAPLTHAYGRAPLPPAYGRAQLPPMYCQYSSVCLNFVKQPSCFSWLALVPMHIEVEVPMHIEGEAKHLTATVSFEHSTVLGLPGSLRLAPHKAKLNQKQAGKVFGVHLESVPRFSFVQPALSAPLMASWGARRPGPVLSPSVRCPSLRCE